MWVNPTVAEPQSERFSQASFLVSSCLCLEAVVESPLSRRFLGIGSLLHIRHQQHVGQKQLSITITSALGWAHDLQVKVSLTKSQKKSQVIKMLGVFLSKLHVWKRAENYKTKSSFAATEQHLRMLPVRWGDVGETELKEFSCSWSFRKYQTSPELGSFLCDLHQHDQFQPSCAVNWNGEGEQHDLKITMTAMHVNSWACLRYCWGTADALWKKSN